MYPQTLSASPAVATSAPTLLSVAQVAERTGASVPYWRKQIRLRRIRAYRLGDLVRIAEPDLAAYLASCAALPPEVRR